MSEWVQIVSTIGFPIAMCLMLCWYIYTTQKELNATINKNTLAIEKLAEKLDKKERED